MVVNYLSNDAAAQQTVAACQAAGGDAWAVKADVGNATEVQTMVDSIVSEAGCIDMVVNNTFKPYTARPEQRRRF